MKMILRAVRCLSATPQHQPKVNSELNALAVRLLILTLTVCAAASRQSRAQGWNTIYTVPNDGTASTSGNCIAVDSLASNSVDSKLWIGGISAFGSVLRLDLLTDPITATASDPQIVRTSNLAFGDDGNFYSGGSKTGPSGFQWQVRRNDNEGGAWTVLDDGNAWWPNKPSLCYGVAADLLGNVYATGKAEKANGDFFWVIRKGLRNGGAWTTVYQASKSWSMGRGIVVVPPFTGKHEGGIFVAGQLTPGNSTLWTVLRSRDSGNSWVVVDSWTPGKNQAAAAKAIASDRIGNIFVAGYDGGSPSGWWVRKSEDGGASWQTILAKYSGGGTALHEQPEAIATDLIGNLYVTGLILRGNRFLWAIRRWDSTGKVWDNWSDELRYPLLQTVTGSCFARGITTDTSGHVYVTGDADHQWIVQRLLAP